MLGNWVAEIETCLNPSGLAEMSTDSTRIAPDPVMAKPLTDSEDATAAVTDPLVDPSMEISFVLP